MVDMLQSIQRMGAGPLAPDTRNVRAPSGFQAELKRQINVRGPQKLPSSTSRPTQESARPGLIHVGTISRENPTVSHLLISHPDYGRDCWEIIHSKVNAQKAFRSLREGEAIFLNPATHEVVWNKQGTSPMEGSSSGGVVASHPGLGARTAGLRHPAFEETGSVATDIPPAGLDSGSLATALKPYMGTPYEKLDCYEFVVEGLKEMGVRYGGQGGLQNHLIQRAVARGLPMNAYLTGNGLIDAASTTVFDRIVTEGDGTKRRAERLWKDLEPRLEEGLIVSFSTGGRGHTGVVSRYGKTWTFLNSGDIDNSVNAAARKKGVGEEELRSEIANWLRRADRRGASLRITLGRLNRDKLASFMGAPSYGRTA
ncbi:MAG: hypothetical protein JRJ85_07655 [Deltaproteobacteria bacterium]|nr:hypothetical protein [Deltaproteobacteria bacterium]